MPTADVVLISVRTEREASSIRTDLSSDGHLDRQPVERAGRGDAESLHVLSTRHEAERELRRRERVGQRGRGPCRGVVRGEAGVVACGGGGGAAARCSAGCRLGRERDLVVDRDRACRGEGIGGDGGLAILGSANGGEGEGGDGGLDFLRRSAYSSCLMTIS